MSKKIIYLVFDKVMLGREKKSEDSHNFSFYYPEMKLNIVISSEGKRLFIYDEQLFHRVVRVLRINIGEICIFFDRISNFKCKLFCIDKKFLEFIVLEEKQNKILKPSITFLLPLLKRDYFETALYSLVELGANIIQPVITEKIQRKWNNKKEYDRYMKIIIKAAEQSKNFSFPEFRDPIELEKFIETISDENRKIFFDMNGSHISSFVKNLDEKPLVFLIGPEGDLSHKEKSMIKSVGFKFCSLTETVLRSLQAVSLSVGLFRSFLRDVS